MISWLNATEYKIAKISDAFYVKWSKLIPSWHSTKIKNITMVTITLVNNVYIHVCCVCVLMCECVGSASDLRENCVCVRVELIIWFINLIMYDTNELSRCHFVISYSYGKNGQVMEFKWDVPIGSVDDYFLSAPVYIHTYMYIHVYIYLYIY